MNGMGGKIGVLFAKNDDYSVKDHDSEICSREDREREMISK